MTSDKQSRLPARFSVLAEERNPHHIEEVT
jgi:hypothetical protein